MWLLLGKVLSRFWLKAYWSLAQHRDALKVLVKHQYEIIHANDLRALPVAVTAARHTGAKVVFDAHEYSPGQAMYAFGRQRFQYGGYVDHLLRNFASRADAVVTVAEGIAGLYRENYGVAPEVVMNAPTYIEVPSRPVDRRKIQLIHHGGVNPHRRLEVLVEMMRFLPTHYFLTFMFVGGVEGYVTRLKALAERIAPGRIFFRDAVAPSDVVTTIASFDIGACVIPPEPLSYRYSLPNKFFDMIMAGLGVVVGPSPEMARLVRKYRCGAVSEGFGPKDVAQVIGMLSTQDIDRMKQNARAAARELNADVEMGKLMDIYRNMLEHNDIGVTSNGQNETVS
jgi:glycosyltransferase involved in cell wall biosynthesis